MEEFIQQLKDNKSITKDNLLDMLQLMVEDDTLELEQLEYYIRNLIRNLEWGNQHA
jgi:hypothetical protein